MKGKIYRAYSPSNRSYIGQTTRSLMTRIKEHICQSNNKKDEQYNDKFKRALRKYGDLIKWEILEENIKEDILNQKEQFYISKFDSFYNGYNATLGGDNVCNIPRTKIHNEHIGLSQRGKILSSKTKELLSNTRKTLFQEHKIISPTSKLNWEKVRELRCLFFENSFTVAQLMYKFDLSECQIRQILHGNSWKEPKIKILTISDMKGESHPLYRKGHKPESIEKMKLSHRGKRVGEENFSAILTWEKVREIRQKYKTGTYTQLKLSIEYGITRSCIGFIVRNKTWIE